MESRAGLSFLVVSLRWCFHLFIRKNLVFHVNIYCYCKNNLANTKGFWLIKGCNSYILLQSQMLYVDLEYFPPRIYHGQTPNLLVFRVHFTNTSWHIYCWWTTWFGFVLVSRKLKDYLLCKYYNKHLRSNFRIEFATFANQYPCREYFIHSSICLLLRRGSSALCVFWA